MLNILYRVAWLDDELNEKERQYIQMFAEFRAFESSTRKRSPCAPK
ncbi:MAG: hypothetical protein ICV85_15980 [Tolypothrix sp. T3-bin4]|nr:hypothetical protein [Tolypothrix sp. T3-bin4]